MTVELPGNSLFALAIRRRARPCQVMYKSEWLTTASADGLQRWLMPIRRTKAHGGTTREYS